MTFNESIPIAKELAENELAKHFDVDAFIILALVDKMNIDLVPDSNVDEAITDIQDLFINYMKNINSMFNNIIKFSCSLSIINIRQPGIWFKFYNISKIINKFIY